MKDGTKALDHLQWGGSHDHFQWGRYCRTSLATKWPRLPFSKNCYGFDKFYDGARLEDIEQAPHICNGSRNLNPTARTNLEAVD